MKGYEPDIFSAMFTVRDNVLESLEEGVLAFGNDGGIIYIDCGAAHKDIGGRVGCLRLDDFEEFYV